MKNLKFSPRPGTLWNLTSLSEIREIGKYLSEVSGGEV